MHFLFSFDYLFYVLTVTYQTCSVENGLSHQLKSLGFYFQAENKTDAPSQMNWESVIQSDWMESGMMGRQSLWDSITTASLLKKITHTNPL